MKRGNQMERVYRRRDRTVNIESSNIYAPLKFNNKQEPSFLRSLQLYPTALTPISRYRTPKAKLCTTCKHLPIILKQSLSQKTHQHRIPGKNVYKSNQDMFLWGKLTYLTNGTGNSSSKLSKEKNANLFWFPGGYTPEN